MNGVRGFVDGWPARSNSKHNPFQRLLSEATQVHGWSVREFSPVKSLVRRADIWHWHWPDGQFGHRSRLGAWLRLFALLVLLQKARLTRTPIVWTAHNFRAHESKNRKIEERFWPIFYRHVSAVHYLSHSSRAVAVERYPSLASKPYVVTHHGHYKDVYGTPYTKRAARASLNLCEEKPTIVFCGKVRAYKGVTDLIDTFHELTSLDAQLVIAGFADEGEETAVREAASSDPRILLNLKLLSDEEIKQFVCAADVVVLPYREITNSGSALLALSLDRPILASNRGSMPELVNEAGNDWVMTYDELTPHAIAGALEASLLMEGMSADLEFCSWQKIGADISELYSLVHSPEASPKAFSQDDRRGDTSI